MSKAGKFFARLADSYNGLLANYCPSEILDDASEIQDFEEDCSISCVKCWRNAIEKVLKEDAENDN